MSELKKGTIAMVAAYIWWGLMTFYWYILNHVPSMEITAYRVSFSFITILVILVFTKNLKVFSILKNRKKAMLIALGALMLAVNWSLFIYAVSIGSYSEAGMGYYINPIVSILLGLVFLKEKMSKGQVAALILVTTGVIYYIISMGVVPYIALLLALTFAIYGLYKKTAGLGSVQALAVETAFLFPISIAVLVVLGLNGGIALSTVDFKTDILIVLAGAATLIPLLLFAEGAVRIPLIRVGFLQYIAPTLMLLAGVVLGEKMNVSQLICFCFIWAGLAVYTITNYRNRRGMNERTNYIGPAAERGQP